MEPQAPSLNPMLHLLCSYGGWKMPLPPAKPLQYIGGETCIIAVPRGVSFQVFFELLSDRSFSLKYRLPGCDLDTLITVDNKDDLQNMIAEYDSSSFRCIRLFLFPLNHPESTQHTVSVNRLLGLESPVQKTSFTSLSYLIPIPIFPPYNGATAKRVDHGKIDATAEENRIKDKAHNTTASLIPPGITAANVAGRVSDKETEKVKIEEQSRPIVQEPLQQQQQRVMLHVVYYVPVWLIVFTIQEDFDVNLDFSLL